MNRVDLSRRIIVENWKWLSGSLSYVPTLNAPVHLLLKQLQLDWVPKVAPWQWVVSLVGVLVLVLLREPRLVAWLTRLALGRVTPKADLQLFMGARPYTAEDTLPDRDVDENECWRKIREVAFFILEGESGCGKSSLLNARLLPRARRRFQVVESRVEGDPFGRIASAFLERPYSGRGAEKLGELELKEAIDSRTGRQTGQGDEEEVKPILLCLDQFEELFQSVQDETRERLAAFLKSAIEQGKIRLILAIRSDYRDLLNTFSHQVDPELVTFKLRNSHRLGPFDREQAQQVMDEILEPAYRDNALLEERLKSFGRELVDELLRPPSDPRLYAGDEKKVLPVELQIAGYLLQTRGVAYLDRRRLRDAGGYAGLTREYIQNAKSEIMAEAGLEGSKTLMILRRLAPTGRVKGPALTVEEIAEAMGLPVRRTQLALSALARLYVVKPLAEEGDEAPMRYALMHDHIARIVSEAPDRQSQKHRDARERIQFWMERSEAVRPDEPGQPSTLSRLWQKLFSQPVSLIESLKLLPWASNAGSRRFLRRAIGRSILRYALIGIPLIALGGYWGQIVYEAGQSIAALEVQALDADPVRAATALLALKNDLHRADSEVAKLVLQRGALEKILEAIPGLDTEAMPSDSVLTMAAIVEPLLLEKMIEGLGSATPALASLFWLLDGLPFRDEERAAEAGQLRQRLVNALRKQQPCDLSICRGTATSAEEEWITIPTGSFEMGSTSGDEDEGPPHRVQLSGFRLLQHEVTNQEFAALFGSPWAEAAVARPRHPAAELTWYQAYVFAAWLGGRLPTEAEWEYAARSGGKDQVYPWPDQDADICRRAVVRGCEGKQNRSLESMPVCSLQLEAGRTEQGLCDMAGNVWEWVADWQARYSQDATEKRIDPVGPSRASGQRVFRGGSFDSGAGRARASVRYWFGPSSRFDFLGFRVALPAAPNR